MKFPVFTRVALTEDIPEYGLRKGAIGTIVESYPMSPDGENGYSLEGLIDRDTIEVSESRIERIPIVVKSA
ncbi:DUF4926 domain-containing protein [Pannus brasiliensis CCIBt3594]|uniref:DUF4926 domain-containing protein n=1 Tax=Pannus brasiliensis CCIBt3594 TaxID=1427578 RepID=A0AAW9QW83_9CHRO